MERPIVGLPAAWVALDASAADGFGESGEVVDVSDINGLAAFDDLSGENE